MALEVTSRSTVSRANTLASANAPDTAWLWAWETRPTNAPAPAVPRTTTPRTISNQEVPSRLAAARTREQPTMS
jgi:hypothetical protein